MAGTAARVSAGFSAAINWDNGSVTFIKGREGLTYDLATNKAGDPRPIADTLHGLPEAWSGGIDTAVNFGDGSASATAPPEGPEVRRSPAR